MIKYLDELKSLNLPKGKFAIFSSGPLSVRGLRKNEDLDVLVTPDLWNELAEEYPITTKKGRPDSIYIGHIQILEVHYKDWSPHITDATNLLKSKKEVILLHLDEKNLKNFSSSNSSRGKITPKCCCCSICYCSYLLLLVWKNSTRGCGEFPLG